MVYFVKHFKKIREEAQSFGLLISTANICVFILTKMGWAIFWETFSKNSSGHPDHRRVGFEARLGGP
jgi:hypothetical protein